MNDILTSLGKLSLTFQKTSIDLALVQPRVQTTISFLNSLKSNDGPVMKQLSKALNEDLTVYNLHADKQKEEKFKREVAHRYIDNLVIHFKDCFPDVELLEAFQLFEPAHIPTQESEELYDHGVLQLETLSQHYSPSLVDSKTAEKEWSHFLPEMSNLFLGKSIGSVLSSLTSNSVLLEMYPELSKLVAAA